jgi:hypothetical protein
MSYLVCQIYGRTYFKGASQKECGGYYMSLEEEYNRRLE